MYKYIRIACRTQTCAQKHSGTYCARACVFATESTRIGAVRLFASICRCAVVCVFVCILLARFPHKRHTVSWTLRQHDDGPSVATHRRKRDLSTCNGYDDDDDVVILSWRRQQRRRWRPDEWNEKWAARNTAEILRERNGNRDDMHTSRVWEMPKL